ncbi:putative siderophore transport system ATP-binding protein YusV [Clavibacter michiganensis]|uniref:Putative siderophore transport system ATP-binding protein YusV n=1 Tax=Clavibacter michiganensis TaxID=28447 RepID=A0A251Y4M3_9MICO|nr:ABC transporter ATP-binding protein [Clavibacter michiganensis]OUE18978.1 putative siderophore transport system ATP-binding protein YusV [Clavibacter michiganensis]
MTSPAPTSPIRRAVDPDPVAGIRAANAAGAGPGRPAASALAARDVTVAYGDTAVVHGAGLEIRPGCVTVLVGPNGSGKSTLLRTMARLQAARSGSLALVEEEGAETDALDLSLRRFARRVALLTQGRPTPGGLSVRDVVEFGRYPHRGRFGGADPEGRAAVDRALDLTGLVALADRGVDQLSGGQLQRVWLASCLAQETGVLLLDEPTTYLDLRYQVELLDLVRDLADDGRIAVGVVLHDLDQAAALADTVALLSDGRIVKTGTPAEVLTPDLLTEVYGIPVEVHADPTTGSLRTRAVARHHHRNERLHP